MNIVDSLVIAFGLLWLLTWVCAMIAWARRGMPIPLWMHIGAVVALLCGVAVVVVVAVRMPYMISVRLVLGFVIGAPVVWYFIWFYYVTPYAWIDDEERETHKKRIGARNRQ